jgi:hypothetical protein
MYFNEYVHTIPHQQGSRSTPGGTFSSVGASHSVAGVAEYNYDDAMPVQRMEGNVNIGTVGPLMDLFSVDVMSSVNGPSRCAHPC